MLQEQAARRYMCGMQTSWSELQDAETAVLAAAHALEKSAVGQVLAFFSASYDVDALNAALGRALPGIPVAGCSNAGGICPAGAIEHGLVLVAFPRDGFRIASTCLPNISNLDVERAEASIRALRRRLDRTDRDPLRARRFALSLIDGLANVEETVVSTVAWALDGIPLVGGSAGDDLHFRQTALLHDGAVVRNGAIILLVETDFPTQLFKSDNFDPTAKRFVVTRSDAETRTVHEFNAEPAAIEYALSVGLDPNHLTPMSFAAHPLVVKIGGEYYCRSIRRLNEDGSLSFFCAIDEGVVLTLAEPRDLVQATHDELARVERGIGGLDLVIGFDCVLRRIEAESRQQRHRLSDLYRQFNVVGFETYGEQYRSMHLNQTFTGMAIGAPRPA